MIIVSFWNILRIILKSNCILWNSHLEFNDTEKVKRNDSPIISDKNKASK